MAEIFNQLHRGDINDTVKRALGATKSPGGVERYGEAIMPVIDPWRQSEWAVYRKEYLWTGAAVQAAVAAERSVIGVVNPAGSNQILVVEAMNVLVAGVAGECDLGFASEASALATLGLSSRVTGRDQRAQPDRTSFSMLLNANVLAGTDPAGFVTNVLERVSGSISQFLPFVSPPYILKPGGGIFVTEITVNQAMNVNLSGRVRQAYPGELV